jgi:hypothetical protein
MQEPNPKTSGVPPSPTKRKIEDGEAAMRKIDQQVEEINKKIKGKDFLSSHSRTGIFGIYR